MTIDELKQIIRTEALEMPVLYGAGETRNDAAVLERDGDTWKFYLANERGGMHESTYRTFTNESDALEYTLLKLRQIKKASKSLADLSARKQNDAIEASPIEVVFSRENGWIPKVIRKDGALYLMLGGGADANHDARTFFIPISKAHLDGIKSDFTRHMLLWSALLPLCDEAGTHGPLNESAAVALLDPILFGSKADVEALFKEIKWDKRRLIAQGATIELLERGDIFTALKSAGTSSDWNLVWEYDANRDRARRGVQLSPLDAALLKYTDRYLHGGKSPMRTPDAVTPELLPQVLDIITVAEQASAGMELPPNWSTQKQDKDWDKIKEKVERAVREAYPTLVDDAVKTVGFLMCSEAADRVRKKTAQ